MEVNLFCNFAPEQGKLSSTLRKYLRYIIVFRCQPMEKVQALGDNEGNCKGLPDIKSNLKWPLLCAFGGNPVTLWPLQPA